MFERFAATKANSNWQLGPFWFFERFAVTVCKLAVEGPQQETLFLIRKGIPDIKLFLLWTPGLFQFQKKPRLPI